MVVFQHILLNYIRLLVYVYHYLYHCLFTYVTHELQIRSRVALLHMQHTAGDKPYHVLVANSQILRTLHFSC